MSYRAPIADIQFLFREVFPLDRLFALAPFADFDQAVTDAVLEQGGRFASEVLAPINQTGDREGARLTEAGVVMPASFKDAYHRFVADGWNGVSADRAYGGQGLPEVVGAALSEMWQSANLSFALCPLLTQGAIDTLALCASPDQKGRYLGKLVTGEWTGTMNLTEPQAGSDLGLTETLATPVGDHYEVRGQKIFITYGEHDLTANIIHLALARTPQAPAGTRGLTLFVIPRYREGSPSSRTANEVRALSIEHKMGIHASPTCVMGYGGMAGAYAEQLGGLHQGMEQMFIMMNRARLSVGQQGVGIAEQAFQAARDFARNRIQGRDLKTGADRVLIIKHPDVRRMLLTMAAQTEAARTLTLWTFFLSDLAHHAESEIERSVSGARVAFLTPVVKGFATEMAQEVTSLGIQVHGGMGYIEETGVAQLYRDARILTIYEGTTGIQAMDLLGRKLVRDQGQAWRALEADIRRSLQSPELGAVRHLVEPLRKRVDDLHGVVEHLLQEYPNDPYHCGGSAYSLLMLFGTVLGGWMLAQSAAAAARVQSESGSQPFLERKIRIAEFYMALLLPRADAYAKAAAAPSPSIMTMDDSQL
ncbi:acyl-CoA dehydrogenase domain protein [mine drainage metagenome]|uniref:Acyl-CoA dehydrogenase domain protein n=2 Tax=mine drainage metagenome TaxID=410659 RepID=T1AAZ4_9ZZZZ